MQALLVPRMLSGMTINRLSKDVHSKIVEIIADITLQVFKYCCGLAHGLYENFIIDGMPMDRSQLHLLQMPRWLVLQNRAASKCLMYQESDSKTHSRAVSFHVTCMK